MKCEKCGKNEANFYYKETVNGRSRELHLCSECAEEEGLTSRMESCGSDLFDLFFSSFGLPSLGGFLRPAMAAQPRMMKTRSLNEEGWREQASPVDGALKKRREQNMLRAKLQDAVAREDYETAITLRDQLRAMENGSAEA